MSEVEPQELIETGIKKKRVSRWVTGSGIPRYDKAAADMIMDKYVSSPEWVNGAKVVPYTGPKP